MDKMSAPDPVRLALPKGHMQKAVADLLSDAGIRILAGRREYRPAISLAGFEVKLLKPQSIVEMLSLGSRDIGFVGADWVRELDGGVDELLDTGLDPVRLVAAAPGALLRDGALPERPLVVASEYERITRAWIERRGLQARFLRSYGATEVLPPEDADCIVDNTATGSTLRANGLEIVEELMDSSTRLYANPRAMADAAKATAIKNFVLVLRSVLEARRRVMVELNVGKDCLEQVIEVLPCMREPTISNLHGNSAFAVKVAVPRADLPSLIPVIKQLGGSDVVVTELSQIVP
jgi:ATP phosphoribosyltransferase